MGKSKKDVFVVDMLNDFGHKDGKIYCDVIERITPNTRKILDVSVLYGIPVFYLNDCHELGDRELKIWEPHAMKGTWGAEILEELHPKNIPYKTKPEIVEKKWYSGFTHTDLSERLDRMDIKEVYITGVHTNLCDRHTSYDAYVDGYDIVIVSDATGAFVEKDHVEGLQYIDANYISRVLTTEEVIEEFKSAKQM